MTPFVLFPLCTHCPHAPSPRLQQVKAAVTKEDKIMVLLDSHHSEIHVMVSARVERPMGQLHRRFTQGGCVFYYILCIYVRMLTAIAVQPAPPRIDGSHLHYACKCTAQEDMDMYRYCPLVIY